MQTYISLLHNNINDFFAAQVIPTIIIQDNTGSIYLETYIGHVNMKKHEYISLHHVRKLIKPGIVSLEVVNKNFMMKDIIKKSVYGTK